MTKYLFYLILALCAIGFSVYAVVERRSPRYPDRDGDGSGDSRYPSCWWFLKSGSYVANKKDCNDGDSKLNSNDVDKDGFSSCSDDCDDSDRERFRGNPEVCDGIDNNCDRKTDEGVDLVYYPDADSDGYGDATKPMRGCSVPPGHAKVNGDCDDTSASAHPGGTEIEPDGTNRCSDGLDNDCNGKTDLDDEACQDADADAIPNGEDRINTYDQDQDRDKKHETLCVTAALSMKPPWSLVSVHVLASPPLGASDRFNGPLDPLRKLGIPREDVPGRPSAWCMDFRMLPPGIYTFLLVSEMGKSGESANLSTCRDWVYNDLSAFCKKHGGNLEIYCGRVREKNACGKINWAIRVNWQNGRLTEPEPI